MYSFEQDDPGDNHNRWKHAKPWAGAIEQLKIQIDMYLIHSLPSNHHVQMIVPWAKWMN